MPNFTSSSSKKKNQKKTTNQKKPTNQKKTPEIKPDAQGNQNEDIQSDDASPITNPKDHL